MNYYNYFTEIEERFQQRRGAQIYLSTVDWALIESWRAADIPLAAALAGIDQAFEKFESGRRRDAQRPRSLLYCAAAVLDAAAAMRAASAGAAEPAPARAEAPGLARGRIARFLAVADDRLAASPLLDPSLPAVAEIRATLRRLVASLADPALPVDLEATDRLLTVLDDKLLAALQQSVPVEDMVRIRAELAAELAPYRRTLRAEQLSMIERQFLHRRLLERAQLPRLSLFYLAG